MGQRMTTPERISLGAGLGLIMLATLPRYFLGGHETRLTLVLMAIAAILVVTLIQWRLLPSADRKRLPGLLQRLMGLLVLGTALGFAWYVVTGTGNGWPLSLSHGATAGLLLFALSLWHR